MKRLQTTATNAAAEPDPATEGEEPEAYAEAEAALWGWYLEWSVIARKTLKNRSLLRQLGFLKTSASGKEELVEEEAEGEAGGESAPPPAPAAKAKPAKSEPQPAKHG